MANNDHMQNGHSLSENSGPTRPTIRIASSSSSASSNKEYRSGSPRRKGHKKSPSVIKDIDGAAFATNGGGHKPATANNKPRCDSVDVSKNGSMNDGGQPSNSYPTGVHFHVSAPSTTSTLVGEYPTTSESGGSSGSGSTVRNSSGSRRDDPTVAAAKARNKQKRISVRKPSPLDLPDSDVSDSTTEGVHHPVETVTPLSPQSISSSNWSTVSTASSSNFQDDARSDIVIGDHETDLSTSPEQSIDGEDKGPGPDSDPMRTPVATVRIDTNRQAASGRRWGYGTPSDISYNYPPPHMSMSPNAGTPHATNQGPFTFPLPPPGPPPPPQRQDRGPPLVPISGYELIASRLGGTPYPNPTSDHSSSSGVGGGGQQQQLKPLYRKFNTLHHRILLKRQDEICELEEQLRYLDSLDTQSRRLPQSGGFIPASRRGEQQWGNDLHRRRIEVMRMIEINLVEYSNLLSAHRKKKLFSPAFSSDVREYRHFLTSANPVIEAETRFLDATDDLMCVSDEDSDGYEDDEDDDSSDSASDDDDNDGDKPVTPKSMPRAHEASVFRLRGGGGGGGGVGGVSGVSRQVGVKGQQQQQYHHHHHHRTPSSPSVTHHQQPKKNLPEHHLQRQVSNPTMRRAPSSSSRSSQATATTALTTNPTLYLPLALLGAILLPTLTFPVISSFLARMVLVSVVLVSGVVALLQYGDELGLGLKLRGTGRSGSGNRSWETMDVCVFAGCYGAVMAVLAGIIG